MAMLLMLLKLNTTENSRWRPLPSRGGVPPASVPAEHRKQLNPATVSVNTEASSELVPYSGASFPA